MGMVYSKTRDTTYLVHWPTARVIKAGISKRQRWRAFTSRGAVVISLFEETGWLDALAMEVLLQTGLATVCKPAFRTAKQAEPFLGGRGGGYLECYRLPRGATPANVLASINWERWIRQQMLDGAYKHYSQAYA